MARKKAQRIFSREFKLDVLREIDAGVSVAQAARNHEVHPETIRLWRRTERKYGDRAFAGNGHVYTDEARIAQLERALGQATLEIVLLTKRSACSKSRTEKAAGGGDRACARRAESPAFGGRGTHVGRFAS